MLEVGAGAVALPAIAATRAARAVVATDGSSEALKLLAANLAANGAAFLAERLILRRLTWGDPRHIAELQASICHAYTRLVEGACRDGPRQPASAQPHIALSGQARSMIQIV